MPRAYKALLDQHTTEAAVGAPPCASRYESFRFAFEHLLETGGRTIVELGTIRSYVHGGLPGYNADDAAYWCPDEPERWDVRNATPRRFGDPSPLGKAKYSIPYLLKHGFEVVFDGYQVALRSRRHPRWLNPPDRAAGGRARGGSRGPSRSTAAPRG